MADNRVDLADIGEIEPLSDIDSECLEELRTVLRRHGALNRFGVMLLHEHFCVSDDEILVETVDVENRVLITQPKRRADVGPSIQTNWRLDTGEALAVCVKVCPGGNSEDHYGYQVHQSTQKAIS